MYPRCLCTPTPARRPPSPSPPAWSISGCPHATASWSTSGAWNGPPTHPSAHLPPTKPCCSCPRSVKNRSYNIPPPLVLPHIPTFSLTYPSSTSYLLHNSLPQSNYNITGPLSPTVFQHLPSLSPTPPQHHIFVELLSPTVFQHLPSLSPTPPQHHIFVELLLLLPQVNYNITGLTRGVAYWIRATAHSSLGYGSVSASYPFTPHEKAGAPMSPQLVVSTQARDLMTYARSLNVTWGYPQVGSSTTQRLYHTDYTYTTRSTNTIFSPHISPHISHHTSPPCLSPSCLSPSPSRCCSLAVAPLRRRRGGRRRARGRLQLPRGVEQTALHPVRTHRTGSSASLEC